jgi:hypothetical protein
MLNRVWHLDGGRKTRKGFKIWLDLVQGTTYWLSYSKEILNSARSKLL